jgi:NADPH-dependent 2,4-dienoyl-CoA reductase/sulfur reductase-like enzyme
MKKPVRIIIVGGNAAGPAAAAKAKRFNPNADVILFESSEYISTGTCEMPYVISGDIEDYQKLIFFLPNSFQEEKNVKVYVKHFVEEIDPKKKTIVVKDLENDKHLNFDYDRLILTTGSKAKTIPGFDTQQKNVFTLKTINDLIQIKDYIKKEKVNKAVVIGSGYIGIETAEALCRKNIIVSLIERENLPLPSSDTEYTEQITELLSKNKIKFIGNVAELEPIITGDKVIGVKCEDKYLETDLVLVSVGFEPDNFLARSAKIELGKSGAIKVDSYLKTSDRYIYAAGDNVEILNAVTGKPEYIPLATQAYDLGHLAGENAAGGNKKCQPFVKNISVKIFDKFFVTVGLSTSEAKQNGFEIESASAKARNLVGVMPESDYVFGKVIADKNTKRIIGASFIGGKEISGYADLISALIKLKVPASTLSKINYNYTPPLSPFINLLSIIGKKFSDY